MKENRGGGVPSLFTPPKGWLEADNYFDWYREMREREPVRFDEERDCWDVFRYDDVKRVLSDYETFSSKIFARNSEVKSVIALDPPEHRLYRSIVATAFTPKSVEDMAPRIAEIVDELLDAAEGKGGFDAIGDFAYPLPVIVIAEMLGVRKQDQAKFKHWSDVAVSGFDVESGETPQEYHARKAQNHQELIGYFQEVVEEKRRNPQNDLISALLAAKVEGQALNLPELLAFCNLLLIAGNETTTNLIGNAFLCLAENQGMQEQVRADHALIPAMIEEVLRMRSPIQSIHRVCVRETELNGQRIREGQTVMAWMGAANRDEAKFSDPHDFLLTRAQNPHLAFGNGPHFCLGAPLSRLEARIALETALKRLPQIGLPEGSAVKPVVNPLIHGFHKLQVIF